MHLPCSDLPRPDLIDRIASADPRLVVLDAAAGMGKTWLAAQLAAKGGWTVADFGPRTGHAPMPDAPGRLILCKRPDLRIEGLARRLLQEPSLTLGTADLRITLDQALRAGLSEAEARRRLARSGGWPILWTAADRSDDLIADWLADEVLAGLPAETLLALSLDGPSAGHLPVLPDDPAFPPILRRALRHAIDRRRETAEGAAALARAMIANGQTVVGILSLQQAGQMAEALDNFATAGADFCIHIHGYDAFDQVLAGFSAVQVATPPGPAEEALVAARAMQALKRGEVPFARRLLAEAYGPQANDLDLIFAPGSGFSMKFRAFRLIMLIYEDAQLTPPILEGVYRLLEEMPLEAHLLRGSFYNSVLEFYIRARRLSQARDVAQRARLHYEAAGVPILLFYIALHQAIMQMMSGNIADARRHAAVAGAELARVSHDCPGDRRLLALLTACIDYESGVPDPLHRFLDEELDEFTRGEIWPSLIDFALHYGSQALTDRYSTASAQAFLDRMRLNQARSNHFARMIDLREIAILQNGARWQDAAARLVAMPGRISAAFMAAAGDDLALIEDRDELAQAILWLRQMAAESPARPGLERKVAALLRNPTLNARQRLALEVVAAHVQRSQRDLTAARAGLRALFDTVARLGNLAALNEQRVFLTDLLANKRLRDFVESGPAARSVLRRLTEMAGNGPVAPGGALGLTRREARLLAAICEGGSNKFIAKALGLSEATVKFHLGNLYRKLGVTNRREAIRAAQGPVT